MKRPPIEQVTFDVVGLASPQGSKTRMPNGAMLDGRSKGARDRHADWRTAVAETARDIAEPFDTPFDGALTLRVTFRFPMPKSRPKSAREIGEIVKTTAPDLDKLVRSLCDGLQAGGLIADDARICRLTAAKLEVVGWTGATVTVCAL